MRHFVLFSPGGLGNRLKVLTSGQALAEAAGAKLKFLWPVCAACGCSYEHLFLPGADVETVPECAVESLPRRIGWGVPPTNLLTESGERLELGHMSWLVRPDLYPGHDRIWPKVVKWFDSLAPQPRITQRVQEFVDRYYRPCMLGVHLRRGDFHMWRPDVVANTDATIRAVQEHLTRWPEAGIFLATDDSAPAGYLGAPTEGVRELLLHQFGDRIVSAQPGSLDRTDPAAIEDALVDLLLLRRTQAVVGTASSSFSELAAFGRDVPFTTTEGGVERVLRLEQLARRLGLYRSIMTLARRRLGREPERFYVAWLAVRDSPVGKRLIRLFRVVLPNGRG